MPENVVKPVSSQSRLSTKAHVTADSIRSVAPSLQNCIVAIVSGALLVLSFPDFELSPLAWLALVPLLLLVARDGGHQHGARAFLLGWIFGTVFFYGSCYWLTYSMIHFGGIPPWVAFILLIPGALLLGVFPAIFTAVLARAIKKWGPEALFAASFLWPALEWLRLETSGQLWNALGYSQAYQGTLIQAASWGGVYAVSFLVVTANAAVTFTLAKRNAKGLVVASAALLVLAAAMLCTNLASKRRMAGVEQHPGITVVAIQPNVPMDLIKSTEEMQKLTLRHFEMTVAALKELEPDGSPRIVIWPESPMNFAYGSDSGLRHLLADLTKRHNASILLNSQEVAPNNGLYNAAVLINQEGGLVAQYDKIRLMPFGEYVPLPQWVPGAGLIRGIVGDFTPGSNYRLMPMGDLRAGVFICIESAYPSIARRLTLEGADVLINISNDGYLGPTAVMRQHLANAVFRAVENNRPLVRVTNTGITAFMTPSGEVKDATQGFRPEVRIWRIARSRNAATFYSRHGDVFAAGCAVLSLLVFVFSFRTGVTRKR